MAAAKWRATSGSTVEGREQSGFHLVGPALPSEDAGQPGGCGRQCVRRNRKSRRRGPYAFFTGFFKNFYNTDLLLGKRVSEETIQSNWNVAAGCSATASLASVAAWHEDFRQDLTRIDVPTLVMHGDADRILPIGASGLRTAKLIAGPA